MPLTIFMKNLERAEDPSQLYWTGKGLPTEEEEKKEYRQLDRAYVEGQGRHLIANYKDLED